MDKRKAQSNDYLGYYAGFVSRLVSFLIDSASIAISFSVIVWLVTVTTTMMQFRTILGFSLRNFPHILTWIDQLGSPAVITSLSVLYAFGYFILFWSLTGQTIGKALIGLRVVTTTGKRLSIWRSILRLTGYFLSGATLFLGFLWIILDNQRQGLHDKIAGTYVLYTWDARPDESFLVEQILRLAGRRHPQSPLTNITTPERK